MEWLLAVLMFALGLAFHAGAFTFLLERRLRAKTAGEERIVIVLGMLGLLAALLYYVNGLNLVQQLVSTGG